MLHQRLRSLFLVACESPDPGLALVQEDVYREQ